MTRGQLVPDELTIRLVRERTAQDDCKGGYILDGFPRTPAQARSLEQLAAEQGMDIIPILIDVPFALLEQRMTGRPPCRPPSPPCLDHVEVVLDHQHRVALVHQAADHTKQLADVLEMQAVVGSSST